MTVPVSITYLNTFPLMVVAIAPSTLCSAQMPFALLGLQLVAMRVQLLFVQFLFAAGDCANLSCSHTLLPVLYMPLATARRGVAGVGGGCKLVES